MQHRRERPHNTHLDSAVHGIKVDDLDELKAAFEMAKQVSRNGKPYLINAIIGKTDFRKGSISV